MGKYIENKNINAIQELKKLALEASKKRYPSLPDYARVIHKYNPNTANGLTRCIIDFLKLSGHQAERIPSGGRPIDRTKVVTDILGRRKRIGSIEWVYSTGTAGTADLSATIGGRSVKIEVKIGKDRQSEAQKVYEKSVSAASGIYYIATDFQGFYEWYIKTFREGSL